MIKLGKGRFSTTLIIINGLILVFFTIVISVILLNYSKNIMLENNMGNARDTLVKLVSDIELKVELDMKEPSENLLYNQGLTTMFTGDDSFVNETVSLIEEEKHLIQTALAARYLSEKVTDIKDGAGLIGLVNRNENAFCFYAPYKYELMSTLYEMYLAHEPTNTIKPNWYYFEKDPLGLHQGGGAVMSVNLISLVNGTYLGKQIYYMSETVVQDMFAQYEMSDYGYIELLDLEGKVVFSDVNGSERSDIEDGYIVLEETIAGMDAIIRVHIEESYIFGEVSEVYWINLPWILVVFILFAVILGVISNIMTRPIHPIMRSMQLAEMGDFSNEVDETGQFEVRQLAVYYNQLLTRLDQYVERERKRSVKEKTAELDALIAQINPHFLSNTLEGIVGQARIIGADKISEMAWSLGRLFSLMVNHGKATLRVDQELEHVQMYVNIQNIRYGNRFTLNIDMDEAIGDYETLKLILQPIVENSIVHGFLAADQDGDKTDTIVIKVYESLSDVHFEISDDGIGMTYERYVEVRKKLQISQTEDYTEGEAEKSTSRGNGIGIINIHQRIRLFYGEGYGLNLVYEGGKCIFCIKIPKSINVTSNL